MCNKNTHITYTIDNIAAIAQKLLHNYSDQKIWLFDGELGAGKTTLIKAIGHVLNIQDNITSPTFTLINEYYTKQGIPIYHFDFYRINNKQSSKTIIMDCESYFSSGHYCFIEWPFQCSVVLPDQYLSIKITVLKKKRKLNLHIHL